MKIVQSNFHENSPVPIFMKIRPVKAELFHAGGPTDTPYDAKRRLSQSCEGA